MTTRIEGGNADDILIGGPGNDTISGNAGRDLIIANDGEADTLNADDRDDGENGFGEAGEDLVLADFTSGTVTDTFSGTTLEGLTDARLDRGLPLVGTHRAR